MDRAYINSELGTEAGQKRAYINLMRVLIMEEIAEQHQAKRSALVEGMMSDIVFADPTDVALVPELEEAS